MSQQQNNRTPKSYQEVELRCILPKDKATQRIGIAFNLTHGNPVRLSLSAGDAKNLVEGLQEQLNSLI